jgi:hypothetical protein
MGCKVITLESGSTAIICGGEPDHVCNEDATVYMLKSGEEIPMTDENFEKFKDQISGGSVACTICGRSAFINDQGLGGHMWD